MVACDLTEVEGLGRHFSFLQTLELSWFCLSENQNRLGNLLTHRVQIFGDSSLEALEDGEPALFSKHL